MGQWQHVRLLDINCKGCNRGINWSANKIKKSNVKKVLDLILSWHLTKKMLYVSMKLGRLNVIKLFLYQVIDACSLVFYVRHLAPSKWIPSISNNVYHHSFDYATNLRNGICDFSMITYSISHIHLLRCQETLSSLHVLYN